VELSDFVNELPKKDIESTETGRYASTAARTLKPVTQNQQTRYSMLEGLLKASR
jgi:hypothetical protein